MNQLGSWQEKELAHTNRIIKVYGIYDTETIYKGVCRVRELNKVW